MKKFLLKLGTLALAAVTAFSVAGAAACGSGNTENTLVIKAASLGYGTNWLKAVASAWSKETGNEVKIEERVGGDGSDAIMNEVESYASDTDIFVYRTGEYAKNVYRGKITHDGTAYDCVFTDLTDVVRKPLSGENGATIESKLNASYRDIYCVKDKYYGLPWIEGVMGILRNVTLWNKLGLTDADIPLTTDELFATCDKIKVAAAGEQKYQNVAPFIYSAEDEYFTSFMNAWFMQYEGAENSKNFLNGLDPEGMISQNIFGYEGQREMFDVLEKLVKKSNGYQHKDSEALSFTNMQSYFLLDQAVFCVNGAWIELEMGSNYPNANIEFIKTPVISALAKKLSFYNAAATDNDQKLSAIVKFVDENESGYAGKPDFATEADVDRVREARNFNYSSQGGAHLLAGNAYSKKTDMIKSFVEFMYSDKGMKEYYNATKGARLPLSLSSASRYDDIELSAFQKKVSAIKPEEVFVYASSARLFSIAGVNLMYNNGLNEYVKSLASGAITGRGVLATNAKYVSDNWGTISQNV